MISMGSFAQEKKARTESKLIENAIDKWHKAAATANYTSYFALMTENSVFIGTDHTEKWDKKAFMAYSKPHFDKGKAWSFHSFRREIAIIAHNIAWFDELLDTEMGICRGSGLMVKENGQWKIARYVLSMSIPNDNADAVIKIKIPIEDQFMTTKNLR